MPLTLLKRLAIAPAPLGTSRRYMAYGYTQAKALAYSKYGNPKDVLRLHSHSIAPAYGDDITVRFLASPINPADINTIEGVYPSKPPMTINLGTSEPSAVPGSEGVVEIVSTGANVKNFKAGDRAIMRYTGFGTWRTHASAKEKDLLRISDRFRDSITPIQAATVSVNPCSAYRMLKDYTTLEKGDWFIQNGANSGVGRAAIQLGRLWGLKSINIVRKRPELDELKVELKGLGADVVITEEELEDRGFKDTVKELTEGKGIALGLNCVGGKATTNMIRQLRMSGHLVTYGAMARQPLTIPASAFIFKDLKMHGFWLSQWVNANPKDREAMIEDVFSLIAAGKFKEVPIEKTAWKEDTPESELIAAVERSGAGFGGKKQVFMFEV